MPRTSKLSDLQLTLLTTAAQRSDGSLMPPPAGAPEQPEAIAKAVVWLIRRGLARKVEAPTIACAWREDHGRLIGASISDQGRLAVGLELASPAPELRSDKAPDAGRPGQTPSDLPAKDVVDDARVASLPREGSKQAIVVRLLQQPDGATLADLMDATGWLPHTTRAALTGLRKRGHAIVSDKASGTMRYRIEASA